MNLKPNTIQITSVTTQNPGVVCSNPNGYNYWWVNGFVDFTQIYSDDILINGMKVQQPAIPLLNWLDYPYEVHMNLYVDGRYISSDTYRSADLYRTHKNCDTCAIQEGNGKFEFSLSGVSPTESHVLKASFTLESPYAHITSSTVDVTYSMPKLC